MKKFTFVGTLTEYERLNSSTNGNPKYYGVFEDSNGNILCGRTATDASCGYSFLNNREAQKEIQYHVTKSGDVVFDSIKEV